MPSFDCARCTTGRYYVPTGCLCETCEKEIDGMTQDQLDADYARYGQRKKVRRTLKEQTT